MQVSEVIKLARQKTFLTQEEFSKKLGISLSSVIRWEKEKSVPNLSAMKKLKRFFDENQLSYEILEKARFGDNLSFDKLTKEK